MSTHLLSESTSLRFFSWLCRHIQLVCRSIFNITFKLCRHMINMCRPVFNISSERVDTSFIRVHLSLSYLLSVSTLLAYVLTCLHFCINLLSLIVESYVDTSSKWVDLLEILQLTVLTHTACVSVCFQRILQTVSTHDKYMSTCLWVICLACRRGLHTCQPIFEISA